MLTILAPSGSYSRPLPYLCGLLESVVGDYAGVWLQLKRALFVNGLCRPPPQRAADRDLLPAAEAEVA